MSSGVLAEKELREILQKKGYYVVRSDKSEGLFDLIALRDCPPEAIQVKSTGKDKIYVEKLQRNQMEKLSKEVSVKPIIAAKIKEVWFKCDVCEMNRSDVKTISERTPKEICKLINKEDESNGR